MATNINSHSACIKKCSRLGIARFRFTIKE